MPQRAYKFGRHDRIVVDGAHYRCVESKGGRHLFQLIVGYVFEDHYVPIDDVEITKLLRGASPRMRIDEGHWTECQRRSKTRPVGRSKSRPPGRQGRDIGKGPIGPFPMSRGLS